MDDLETFEVAFSLYQLRSAESRSQTSSAAEWRKIEPDFMDWLLRRN